MSDMYALGMSIFVCKFPGETFKGIENLPGNVSEHLRDLLSSLLNSNPDKRLTAKYLFYFLFFHFHILFF